MAAVTICSDFEAQENKVYHCFRCFLIYINIDDINNLRYADDTTFMAESEEEVKSLLMKVKEESEKLAENSVFRKLRSWHLVPSLHSK